MLVGSLAATSIAAGAAWWLDSRLGLVLLAFTLGTAGGVARLSFDAIVQRDAEDRRRSRSFARFEATFQLAWVAAALIATAAAGRGASAQLTPVAVWAEAGGAAIYYVVIRRVDRHHSSRAPVAPRAPSSQRPPGPAGPGRGPRRNRLRGAASSGVGVSGRVP